MAGTWASVITEDWQWRFVTPIVGDYTGVPLNADGDRLARQWNPEADVKAGQQCKGFGAAAINRLPTRLQISWVDDNTMKLDFDLGTQSRLVYFDKTKAPGARSLQGHAIGEWIDLPAPGRGGPVGQAPARRARRRTTGGRCGAASWASGSPGRGRARRTRRRRGRGAARGRVEDRHHQPAAAVPPAERRAGEREGGRHRVPRRRARTRRYAVAGAQDAGGRSRPILSGWYQVSSNFKKEATAAKWSPTPCELLPRLKGTATQVPRQGGE